MNRYQTIWNIYSMVDRALFDLSDPPRLRKFLAVRGETEIIMQLETSKTKARGPINTDLPTIV